MMRIRPVALGAMAAALAVPALSSADIRLPKERIIPVTFDREINLQNVHEGDRFSATVVDELDLPRGTKLDGEVMEVQQKRGDHPAFVDMEFRSIRLPDGRGADIQAVPIRLDDRYVHQDRDGHFVVDARAVRKENVLLGGALGGFILGSILKRPFEGTFLGILAGIVANETGALENGVVVARGQKLGALLEADASIEDGNYRGDDSRPPLRRDDSPVTVGEAPPEGADHGAPPPTKGGSGGYRDDGTPFPPDNERRHGSNNDFKVAYGDHPMRFDGDAGTPYMDGKTLMVPLQTAADQLKIDVDKGSRNRLFLQNEDFDARIEQDSATIRLNGRHVNLPKPVVEKDGVLYAPIELFAAIAKDPIYVNGEKVVFKT